MIDFEVKGLKIEVTCDNIKIHDSFKIKKKKDIKECVKEIIHKAPLYKSKRSVNSMVREWKAHNRFYNIGILKSKSGDCDLEAKQFFLIKLFYLIFGSF